MCGAAASPVGMKKQYTTVFDESVLAQEKVYVSGGRIGAQGVLRTRRPHPGSKGNNSEDHLLR